MAFVLKAIAKQGGEVFLGEYWHGSKFEEHLDLCKSQMTESVIRKYLPRNGTILEAGCGWCRWVIYLGRLGYNIIGYDRSERALHDAKSFDASIKLVAGDLLPTGFDDNTFDAILSLGVVEHFREGPQEALRELKRILKPGGILILAVPANNPFRILFVNHLMRLRDLLLRFLLGYTMAFTEYRFSKKELTHFLSFCGYQIIDFAPDDLYPPLSMGLYVDFLNLTGRIARTWRPPPLIRFLRGILDTISPEFACGGYAFVARVEKDKPPTEGG